MKYWTIYILTFPLLNTVAIFGSRDFLSAYYEIDSYVRFNCPEYHTTPRVYTFNWNLISQVEDQKLVETIKHGHRQDGSNTTLDLKITPWMSYVNTTLRCEIMNGSEVSINDYLILVSSKPKLISFTSRSESNKTVVLTCIMEGSPTLKMELLILKGRRKIDAVDDIYTTDDGKTILTYETNQEDFLQNTFVCNGYNYLGKFQSTLNKTREIGIFGPEPFTYKRGDNINLTCNPPTEYMEEVTFKWKTNQPYKYTPTSSQVQIQVLNKAYDFRCFVNSSYTNDTWNSDPFPVDPGFKPEVEKFVLTKYFSQGKLKDKIECEISGSPLPVVRLFLANQRPPYPSPVIEFDYIQQVSRLTWNLPVNEKVFLKHFTCVGANRFGIAKKNLKLAKAKFDGPCNYNSDCAPKNSVCINHSCQCWKPLYTARRYNYKEECVQVRYLEEICQFTSQCAAADVNAGCINGYCQCFSPYKMIGNHCWQPLLIGKKCYSTQECQAGVSNSECRRVSTRNLCVCKNGYWLKNNLCIYHRNFLDASYLHTVSILGLAGITFLFVTVVLMLIVSARILCTRRSQHYRETVLKNQKLSHVSDKVPIKNPPPPEIKKSFIDEPHTPVELRVPEIKDRSDSVTLSDEPTICIPETIPFIKDNDNSIC